MATNLKGPAIYLAQFAGDTPPFDSWDTITEVGRRPRLQGRAAAVVGQPPDRPGEGRKLQDLLRRAGRRRARQRRRDHRAGHAPAGPAGGGAPGLRRGLRRLRARGRQGQPEGAPAMGGAADAVVGEGLEAPRAEVERQLSRRAGLALPVPVAAAPAGPDRSRLRRTGQALAADLRCLRRGRLQRRLRAAPGRGPVRRRDLRDVPGARGQPPALLHQLRPLALPAAAAGLPGVHRHLPRAHQLAARQGRRVPARRPAGRVFGLPAVDRSAPGASARWATGRSTSAPSSRRWRSTTTTAGRCSNGNAA